ncbi:MAG TPA: glycoside hydrolase family 172 protein [Candidatus Kryptonia bacterium]
MKRSNLFAFSLLIFFGAIQLASAQTDLDKLFSPSQIPYIRNSRLYHVGSYDTTGRNSDFISIPAGKSVSIMDVQGPGAVARIWMTVGSSDPYYLRRILMRMYWDGEQDPSVEVPLGDFFGTGFGYKQYISRFVGMTSGGFYSYFPMPFNKSAKVEIVNETGSTISSFYYNIDYQKVDQPFGIDVGYFHACWNRDIRTRSKENYLILDAEGRGQFVGCNLNIQGYDNNLWFLEGDEMIYVDGETKPSVNGTGTEDFFNSGWYFNRGEYSAPFHGLIWKIDSTSQIAAYRFLVGDAVPFSKSIRVTIEHGTENTEAADYSSTAYWYQLDPHKKFPPMIKASLRIPLRVAVPNGAVEAESLTAIGSDIRTLVEDMTDYGPDWSGGKQLRITADKTGSTFILNVPTPGADRYQMNIYFTKGPDYGDADILLGGEKIGRIDGYASSVLPGGSVSVKDLVSDGGPIGLKFDITGKDKSASGYSVGIDAILISPEKNFITDWNIIGPFPNPSDAQGNRLGLDIPYPPEKEIRLSGTYSGVGGQKIKWQRVKAGNDGMVNLLGHFNPEELVVSYATTQVYSPKEQALTFLIGSDDGVKVFVDGKVLFRKLENRGAQADQDTMSVKLKKGWNTILMKVENNLGGYGFFARIADPARTLKYIRR